MGHPKTAFVLCYNWFRQETQTNLDTCLAKLYAVSEHDALKELFDILGKTLIRFLAESRWEVWYHSDMGLLNMKLQTAAT